MNIIVTTGKGTGKTLLSAFDDALKDAGVYNYNIITLSSVIPPGSRIIKRKFESPPDEYGHRLYVVKADIRSHNLDYHIGAGLGWYQLEDGRGIFVEHEFQAKFYDVVKETLQKDIKNSIIDLCRARHFGFKEDRMGIATSIAKVTIHPTCCLVMAVYQAQGWTLPTSAE